MPSVRPIVLVHGGAGETPDSRVEARLNGVKKAAREGYKALCREDSSLDAVEDAVRTLEDNEHFNAGRGSVLNIHGQVVMDALITEGTSYKTGSVAMVKNIQNPITLARRVMECSYHSFLAGEGANEFAQEMNMPKKPDEYFITDYERQALEEFKKDADKYRAEWLPHPGGVGTVGCVAVNSKGQVASGTSTGGLCGKSKGRIGDTPLPGSGGYSDDKLGAVSTTGHGESIMRFNLAHRILNTIQTGQTVQSATESNVEMMHLVLGGVGGAISVSNTGEVGIAFTTNRMPWAYQTGDELHFGLEPGEHIVEKVF